MRPLLADAGGGAGMAPGAEGFRVDEFDDLTMGCIFREINEFVLIEGVVLRHEGPKP
jgi:hypothetical protein